MSCISNGIQQRHYETYKNLTYRLSWEFFFNCLYMLVFHVKDVKTGFVEIVFQRVSNKIIHFIFQTTIAFFNFIGQFLAFFDFSDMWH
ncbi:hypothetical protein BpHYR1_031455 [Brachionus plicatilis]|uniref:Uncharacterized protein n=1 Tax=Brachionus plicatilis TaxID=10195 RepID=A0A3M7PBA9_BRAPC|nr:hypothetical protein BpHYR1_031455 [Brachionus plicatilis]